MASRALLLCALVAATARAQAPPPNAPTPTETERASELVKASQNPVADLVSVPLQLNLAGGMGPYQRSQLLLNIQPVIPIELTGRWFLLARLILPLTGQPDVEQPQGSTWGVGDFNPQLFINARLGRFTAGVGVTIVIPTATDPALGAGKLSLGPTIAGVWVGGPLVVGALVNNAWSVAGNGARSDVNVFFLQPFIDVNLPHHTFLVTSPQITGNWKDGSWTVPVGGGAGALLKLGLPANVNLQAFWNAVTPAGGPTWLVRLTVAFLFPTSKR